jgi:hypothetical protein
MTDSAHEVSLTMKLGGFRVGELCCRVARDDGLIQGRGGGEGDRMLCTTERKKSPSHSFTQ